MSRAGRRRWLLIPLAGLVAAAAAEPPPAADAAWAAAFTGIATRVCAGFTTDTEAVRDAGGLYDPARPAWNEGGPALLAFRDGGRAAERAFGTELLFCTDPAAAAEPHQRLVRIFLVRKARPGGG